MGPRPPDWDFLKSLSPNNLEEEDADKVATIILAEKIHIANFLRFSNNCLDGILRRVMITSW